MAKVLMLNGSPHKNGCTAAALQEMITVFEQEGIETELIHVGNKANPDSSGCILVGVNDRKGMVTKSTETFRKLWYKLKEADDRGESIFITIK